MIVSMGISTFLRYQSPYLAHRLITLEPNHVNFRYMCDPSVQDKWHRAFYFRKLSNA